MPFWNRPRVSRKLNIALTPNWLRSRLSARMTCMATAPAPKRGEVWLVDFDPSVGRLPLRMVVPITDWKPAYANFPWFVELLATSTNGLTKDSGADCFQTKSVSERRFVRLLGKVTAPQLDEIAAAIAMCVGAP